MARPKRFAPEVRERADRLVLEHQDEQSQWAAISSIAGKMGCSPETLRKWWLSFPTIMTHRSGGILTTMTQAG